VGGTNVVYEVSPHEDHKGRPTMWRIEKAANMLLQGRYAH